MYCFLYLVIFVLLQYHPDLCNGDSDADCFQIIDAWSSSHEGSKEMYGPKLAWVGESPRSSGFFHSLTEKNPWLRIQLNREVTITSVTIINRKDCCGERLRDLELRGGLKNDLTNERIGYFQGPGYSGGYHLISLKKPAKVLFITFQIKMDRGTLQINGLRFTPGYDQINAWSSSHEGSKEMYGPKLAWRGEAPRSSGFFHSLTEKNPWLRIQLNREVTITSVTVINRKDCCGERLRNLELRGGLKNDLTNERIGYFQGPGYSGGYHLISLKKPVKVLFITFQIKMNRGTLQINGIRLQREAGLYRNVYVDSQNGTNDSACGSIHTPCNDLQMAVQQAHNNGTIHIIQAQVLKKAIVLCRPVTITSAKKSRAVIRGHNVKRAFSSTLIFHNAMYRFSRLLFVNIGVGDMLYRSDVRVVDSEVRNATALVFNMLNAGSTLLIEKSLFVNTPKIISVGHLEYLEVTNSKFENTGELNFGRQTRAIVRNCDFTHRISEAVPQIIMNSAKKITIDSCRFVNMRLSTFRIEGLLITRCFFADKANMHTIDSYSTTVRSSKFIRCSRPDGGAITIENIYTSGLIEDCVFTNNSAKIGGAVYINSKAYSRRAKVWSKPSSIINSKFHNNEATDLGQAIYSGGQITLKNVSVSGSTKYFASHIQVTAEMVYLDNVEVILRRSGRIQAGMRNSGISISSSDLRVTGQIEMTCPKHSNIVNQTNWYTSGWEGPVLAYTTFFIARCDSCPANKYTLGKGKLTLGESFGKPLSPSVTQHKCLSCPLGGLCDGNIVPVDNYWGYIVSSGSVESIQCPTGYCCSSQTTPCETFNTCNLGRAGKMCGSCAPGYFLSFGSDACIRRKEGVKCNLYLFVASFILISMNYSLLFTFLSVVVERLKNLVASRKRAESDSASVEEVESVVIKSAVEENMAAESHQVPFGAYITLVFLFFQLASLIHLDMQLLKQSNGDKGNQDSVNAFQKLFAFFNFRFNVPRNVCPSSSLTYPMKEFINIVLKIASLFNLFLFYIVYKCVSWIKMCLRSIDNTTESDEDAAINLANHHNMKQEENQQTTLTFTSLLKIGFIKLVKLNFTAISTYSIRMVHCVSINNNLHLYLHGDLQCYTLWQQIILFLVVPIVVMFPASFGMALNLLKDGLISPTTLCLSSVMPLHTFYMYARKRFGYLQPTTFSGPDEKCTKTILEMEEELFKDDVSLFRWPVVQLYRNLLVVVLSSFILNPMYRTLVFIPLFLIFAIHDRSRMPYKHNYLNLLQTLSSVCLVVVVSCNIPAAFSVMFNLANVPHIELVVALCLYLEIAVCGAVPFSLVVYHVYNFYSSRRRQKSE